MDLAKLKVVELRAHLAARGLDQKGVKAVLVSRLQAALDQENQQNIHGANSFSSTSEILPPDPSNIGYDSRNDNENLAYSDDGGGSEDPPQSDNPTNVFNQPEWNQQTVPENIQNEPNSEEAQKDASILYVGTQSEQVPLFNYPEPDQMEPTDYSNANVITSVRQPPPEEFISRAEPQYEQKMDEDESVPDESERSLHEDAYDGNNDVTAIVTDEPEEDKSNEEEDDSNDSEVSIKSSDVPIKISDAPIKISEVPQDADEDDDEEEEEDDKSNESENNEVASESNDAPLRETFKDENEDVAMSNAEAITKAQSADENDRKSESEKNSDRRDNRKRKRSGSRSKSQTPPAKRPPRRSSPIQNTEDFTNDEDEPDFNEDDVLLSWFDSDLHLKISPTDFCSARPISESALGLAWSGARATYGVNDGKVCYEVQINEINRVQNLSDERNLYELRCGWSILSESLQLGETELSFGYSGCAKKCVNKEFSDYGIKYGSRGDVIGAYLDLDSTPCTIQYTVNGESQGIAFEFNKDDLNGSALYPHIISKNLAFTVNFGQREKLLVNEERPNRNRRENSSRKDSISRRSDSSKKESCESPSDKDKSKKRDDRTDENESKKERKDSESTTENELQRTEKDNVSSDKDDDDDSNDNKTATNGDKKIDDSKETSESNQIERQLLPDYILIAKLPKEQLVRGYIRPATRKECEAILMVGLPGAGKTFWANNHSKQNIDKHYNILGVQNLLDKMTVCGEPRKKHHKNGRWERFIDWTVRSLHMVQDIANKRRRNYILDQTNVLASAQRRKMKGFGDFKRIAVVVIPDDVTYKERQEKHTTDSKHNASDHLLNEMKANYILPSTECGWFDEIIYTELEGDIAKKKVHDFNEKGKKAVKERDHRDRGSGRNDYHRRDDHRDRYRDRRSSNWGGQNDRRWRQQQSSSQWRSGGGSGSNYGGGRDRWVSGGSSSNNWHNNRRYDDRDRYDRNRYGDRDRRDDRRGGSSRNDRDFRDGNRGGDNSRRDRGVPKKEKDDKSDGHYGNRQNFNSKSSGNSSSSQGGHWNPNVGPNSGGHWNNFYSTQQQQQQHQQQQQSQNQTSSSWPTTANYTPQQQHPEQQHNQQQQRWLQWQQQGPVMQHSQHQSTQNVQSQSPSQSSNNASWMWQQQQQQQQPMPGGNQNWQNWTGYSTVGISAYGVNTNGSNTSGSIAKK